MSKKVLVLLADGFEETEVVVPFDILTRGGVAVSLVALENPAVKGAHGLRLTADGILPESDVGSFDGIFIPGGSVGVENLRASKAVLETVRKFHAAKKWVSAICAGPLVLADAGILSDKNVTSYPSVGTYLAPHCKAYAESRVVLDGKLVTSRGPGSAEEFGLAFLKALAGEAAAESVKAAMLART